MMFSRCPENIIMWASPRDIFHTLWTSFKSFMQIQKLFFMFPSTCLPIYLYICLQSILKESFPGSVVFIISTAVCSKIENKGVANADFSTLLNVQAMESSSNLIQQIKHLYRTIFLFRFMERKELQMDRVQCSDFIMIHQICTSQLAFHLMTFPFKKCKQRHCMKNIQFDKLYML